MHNTFVLYNLVAYLFNMKSNYSSTDSGNNYCKNITLLLKHSGGTVPWSFIFELKSLSVLLLHYKKKKHQGFAIWRLMSLLMSLFMPNFTSWNHDFLHAEFTILPLVLKGMILKLGMRKTLQKSYFSVLGPVVSILGPGSSQMTFFTVTKTHFWNGCFFD